MDSKRIKALIVLVAIVSVATIFYITELVAILLNNLIQWKYWGLVGLALFIILTARFIYKGIRVVQANPPYKLVVKFLGRRQKVVFKEGLVFLPLYPYVFSGVLVKVEKINPADLVFSIRTPDKTPIDVEVGITYTPGFVELLKTPKKRRWLKRQRKTGELPSLLLIYQDLPSEKEREEVLEYNYKELGEGLSFLMYLNSGGENGVNNIISDVVEDRFRKWAFSGEEGPADWEEAIGAGDEAISVLLKAILGDELPKIPSNIPTPILLKYFDSPRRKPFKYEEGKYGENWEKLEELLIQLKPEEKEQLQKAVETRRRDIIALRQGNGYFKIPSLGVTINRFNIKQMKLTGKVAETAELEKAQTQQMQADKVAVSNLKSRVEELKDGLKISDEAAVTAVQVQTGRATRTVADKTITLPPSKKAKAIPLVHT